MLKGLLKKLEIGIASLGIIVGVANASSGVLDITNNLSSKGSNNSLRLNWSSSSLVTEGLDLSTLDTPVAFFMPDYSTVYSVVEGTKLMKDSRPNYVSHVDFNLAHNGVLDPNARNWQSFNFPYSVTFADDTVTFQQFNPADPNVAYPVYDVRKEIHYNAGIVPIADVPAGTYDPEVPYAHGAIWFDRNLADFNNDGLVNLLDWNTLSQEYGKTGNSLADIAIADGNTGVYIGANTTPYFDGVVDLADVAYFAENWLLDYRTE